MSIALSPFPSGPCSLCVNGEAITLPTKEIAIQGFEFMQNCQALADYAPVLFQQTSDECALLQSIGTLCGCPKTKDACELCSDGSNVEYGWRQLGFLAENFGGIVPNCALVEAGLHSYDKSDAYCQGSQLMLSEYCGCGVKPGSQPDVSEEWWDKCHLCYDSNPVPFPDKTIEIIGFPFQTCGQLDQATKTLFESNPVENTDDLIGNNCHLLRQLGVHCGCNTYHEEPCQICHLDDSYEVPYPEKRLDTSLTQFLLGDLEISCGILADVAMLWSATDPDHKATCGAFQGLGTQCGCTMPAKPMCDVCPSSLPQEAFHKTISDTPPYDLITCGFYSAAALFLEDGDRLPIGVNGEWIDFECRLFKYSGFVCGCNSGLFTYWGAETIDMQRAAVWTQRVTAILSLIGSFSILVNIFTTKQRKDRGIYYQIMLGLSISDILSSTAWGLGPVPTNLSPESFGLDANLFSEDLTPDIYGSYGTNATCKVQGFLLHWGFTSILYNVALTYFFKLSVVDGWRDSHFTTRYRVLLLGVPAIIGTTVALSAIPFITFTPVACTIGSYKDPGGWAKLITLFYLPYGPAFVYAPLNTFYIYWKVRAQSRRGNRWRMSGGQEVSSYSMQIDMKAKDSSSRRGLNEGNQFKQILKRVGSTLSVKSPAESEMETLVFWQSCWYVVAFFLSYAIFLVAFALDGWAMKSYWFYLLVSILTPMQGFFNACVYFRKRITKWTSYRTKRGNKTKSLSSHLLLNSLLWPLNMFRRTIRRWLSLSKASKDPHLEAILELASSGNLSQPVEMLNGRRANTTRADSDQEEKAEELPLQDDFSVPFIYTLEKVPVKGDSSIPSVLAREELSLQDDTSVSFVNAGEELLIQNGSSISLVHVLPSSDSTDLSLQHDECPTAIVLPAIISK